MRCAGPAGYNLGKRASPPAAAASDSVGGAPMLFNVLVDLCGVFKRSTIHEVRDKVLDRYGPDRFHFIYHIDQV